MHGKTLALILVGVAVANSGASLVPQPLKAPPKGQAPIAVDSLDKGRIRIHRAGRKRVLNLGREISGCKGRLYDPMTQESSEAEVGFEIVDETEKPPYTYVLLLASAASNCNVQGECGADGSDSTLFWLKITRDLSLAGKQSFPISDCRGRRVAVTTADPGDPNFGTIQAKDLPWVGDVLQIEFEKGDKDEGKTQRLLYDRRDPNAGLRWVLPER